MATVRPVKCKIIAWAIWYEDAFFSSKDTKFEDLPRDGVLLMRVYEERRDAEWNHVVQQYAGYDYYFRAIGPKDYLYGCDLDSRERPTHQDILDRYNKPIILRGKWTDRETLQDKVEEGALWQP